jgi:ABC-2 type transport system permease protein
MSLRKELIAISAIAARDVTKLVRDRGRMLASVIFPFIFIGALGGSLQANLGASAGYNLLTFVVTGVLAQTLFQSTASGLISLVEDRQNDFAQELFIAPISRYSIIFGKILGETIVACAQMLGVFIFVAILQIPVNWMAVLYAAPTLLLGALFGGAFGVMILANLKDQRAANQLFPFLIFPQFFLAGVFNPIKVLPLPLMVLSRIAPMTYAVDLFRSVYYWGTPEYDKVVLFPFWLNLLVVGGLFLVFLTVGTYLFVRQERNR